MTLQILSQAILSAWIIHFSNMEKTQWNWYSVIGLRRVGRNVIKDWNTKVGHAGINFGVWIIRAADNCWRTAKQQLSSFEEYLTPSKHDIPRSITIESIHGDVMPEASKSGETRRRRFDARMKIWPFWFIEKQRRTESSMRSSRLETYESCQLSVEARCQTRRVTRSGWHAVL